MDKFLTKFWLAYQFVLFNLKCIYLYFIVYISRDDIISCVKLLSRSTTPVVGLRFWGE